jgi:hypothetical protein
MTDDLSALPQPVRDALHEMACAGVLRGYLQQPVGIIRAELLRLVAENNALRAFAQDIMRAWPEGDVDGGELQEAALRHGLLEPSEPTQEERDEWGLDQDDLDGGDAWYRKTARLCGNHA